MAELDLGSVLVTGAGGFIGSHLAEALTRDGASGLKLFVHYNARNSWGWIEESEALKRCEIISGDIRDFDSVSRAVQGCDTIFHLAALIGIPYSYVSPLAYIRTNIEGSYNILEAARRCDVRQVLITSTSETYGTAQTLPIAESHPAVGQSPYAATKISADQLAGSYYRSFDLPVKIVRPFNTYGPRQSARAMIPNVISQILAGNRALRLGSVTPTRDLTYVGDTVAGFLAIARCEALLGDATNIGANQEISMGDLAYRIARLMNAEIEIQRDPDRVRVASSEVDRLLCDNARLANATGWKCRYSLDDGLRATIEWMARNQAYYKADVYNI